MFDVLRAAAETVVDAVTKPLEDAAEVLDGFSEGELRERAALRLGADVAAGMALSEVISVLRDGQEN